MNYVNGITPFKTFTSEKTPPYKDPFRIVHARNQEEIKREKKIERREIIEFQQEKYLKELKEERINTANALERYRLLNII